MATDKTVLVVFELLEERSRQTEGECWTARHDDAHRTGQLGAAAACYADPNPETIPTSFRELIPRAWPWEPESWKPKSRRADLVRAGALIIAEIERIDRLPDSKE